MAKKLYHVIHSKDAVTHSLLVFEVSRRAARKLVRKKYGVIANIKVAKLKKKVGIIEMFTKTQVDEKIQS